MPPAGALRSAAGPSTLPLREGLLATTLTGASHGHLVCNALHPTTHTRQLALDNAHSVIAAALGAAIGTHSSTAIGQRASRLGPMARGAKVAAQWAGVAGGAFGKEGRGV